MQSTIRPRQCCRRCLRQSLGQVMGVGEVFSRGGQILIAHLLTRKAAAEAAVAKMSAVACDQQVTSTLAALLKDTCTWSS